MRRKNVPPCSDRVPGEPLSVERVVGEGLDLLVFVGVDVSDVALDPAPHLTSKCVCDVELAGGALGPELAHRSIDARQHAGKDEQVDHHIPEAPGGELLVDDVAPVLAQNAIDRSRKIASVVLNTPDVPM